MGAFNRGIVALISETTAGRKFFEGAAEFIDKLVSMTVPGASAVFGHLATDGGPEFIFAFAGTGLIVIIFVSALFAIMYFVLIRPQQKQQKEQQALKSMKHLLFQQAAM